MKHSITFFPDQRKIVVPDGSNLLKVLQQAGLSPDSPCGGRGTCKKCRVLVNDEEQLSCQYTICSDIVVELPKHTQTKILTSGQSIPVDVNPIKPGYLLAFDIGTTTVVCFLLSPEGDELAAESMLNPQTTFGADVITRIQLALAGDFNALTDAIQNGMTDLIQKCCQAAHISEREISVISVVGNPCMQQLFMGICPDNLAKVPFNPILTHAKTLSASSIFPGCCNASLLVVPDISGYVGADTIGCILATKLYDAEDTVLIVDIGTNGEMVLSHKGRMVACSTAAGPALEGANIQFGMRGTQGAIDHVWMEDEKLQYSVIGDREAIGICGSGLIDAVAVALDQKLINKRGRIQLTQEINSERIIPLSNNVYLTQDDIRQVQMAKGAISAGIQLMADFVGISISDIDRVILAGAFGSFLQPESACRIGLLPQELLGKISAAGNIAGSGAKMLALDRNLLPMTQQLLERIEFLELASVPTFQRTFGRCMEFSCHC